ncbi:MAG: flavin reductase family protein [Caloramator sp.]|nr:flavin reductase family protein [Caloramator sp.]
MYKEVDFFEYSKDILKQIERGAFLTVKHGEKVNTMTIGWGSLGSIWHKPVFIVLVRGSRYTYEIVEKAEDFTVSFPLKGQLKEELIGCGTKSGRDIDKFKEFNLKTREGISVKTPIIDDCDFHFECKIIYKQKMDENKLSDEWIKKTFYNNGDYHYVYYGEILKSYIKE